MLGYEELRRVVFASGVSGAPLHLLTVLGLHAHPDDLQLFLGLEGMAEWMRCGKGTATRARDALVDVGVVEALGRRGGGRGRSMLYRLKLPPSELAPAEASGQLVIPERCFTTRDRRGSVVGPSWSTAVPGSSPEEEEEEHLPHIPLQTGDGEDPRWLGLRAALRALVPESSFDHWLSSLAPVGVDRAGVLVLAAPERTSRWINDRFSTVLARAAADSGVPARLAPPASRARPPAARRRARRSRAA